jgi:hypothetical protein
MFTQVATTGRQRLVALALALLVGLAGLSVSWLASELIDAAPQPVAESCQGSGGGC